MRKKLLLGAIVLMLGCSVDKAPKRELRQGLDVLLEEKSIYLENKKVGVITNQTGITKDSVHIVDTLSKLCDVVAFAPEHGIKGELEAGKRVGSYTDKKTGVKVWSLYGKNKKPTDKMLEGIDLLIYDMQDVGARFYTYISTMGLAMEKASEKGIPFFVLDRNNPITGSKVEGPVLDPKYKSFVGKYEIPIRYGMTAGELAKMINNEFLDKKCKLKVVELKDWERGRWMDEYNLPFVKPSPNIPSVGAAELYPGMCLLEGTNVSVGRGTSKPFSFVGAPWIDGNKLVDELEKYDLKGVDFRASYFTPKSIPNAAANPKYKNKRCSGVKISLTDRDKFNSVQTGIYMIHAIKNLYPEDFKSYPGLNLLFGSDAFSKALKNNVKPGEVIECYKKELDKFLEKRKKYLMY